MRDSSSGGDEVTAGMLRWASEKENFWQELFSILSLAWTTPVSQWKVKISSTLLMGIVMPLWKGKGDVKDLDKYRGIVLLQILSRWVARIKAQRLSKWAELAGALESFQWGFRPGRQTVDVLFVCRWLLEQAASSTDCADPMTIILFDIKKAYPNMSMEVAGAVLTALGFNALDVKELQDLHLLTEYTVKTDLGNSGLYSLLRGFREGCPSSCVCFNIVHNVALYLLQQKLPKSLHFQPAGAGKRTRQSSKQPSTSAVADPNAVTLGGERRKWCPASKSIAINLVGFADDSTAISRLSQTAAVEKS
jgi:hypothetical protein